MLPLTLTKQSCPKELSIKDVRSQERGEVFPVRTFFGQEEERVLQMRTSAIFSAKNCGLFQIYGPSARTSGKEVEPVRTRGKGVWSIFRNFVRTSFMDGQGRSQPNTVGEAKKISGGPNIYYCC